MKPYYEHGGITIFHGDCRDILPSLEPVDLVLTDPPYGIGAARAGFTNGTASRVLSDEGWDDAPPTQEELEAAVAAGANAVVFGGNYFTLPPSPCWFVWDKETGANSYADAELAWTNLPGPVGIFRFRWLGIIQGGAGRERVVRQHPTQKPAPLMRWCIERADNPQTILDPFMGSGTTLRAAKDLGRRAIGIEIEERYCEIAAKRLAQEVLPFGAAPRQGGGE